MAAIPALQIYAELDDYSPRIWRRFQVPGNTSIAGLAYILMTLFEMKASHLFCFEQIKDEIGLSEAVRPKRRKRITAMDIIRYEIHDEDCDGYDSMPEMRDARAYTVKQALSAPGARLLFWYDFGDDWRISLVLEKEINDKTTKELPQVLEGAGLGIVEDCGGVYGLAELAEAFKQKKGVAYDDLREWLGVDDLDMEAFDLNDMNFRLKKIPRIYTRIYEQKSYPTKRSIDLIERRYLKD